MQLSGKHILICGLASERSIAAALVEDCLAQGATVYITYQNQRYQERVTAYLNTLSSQHEIKALACDVSIAADVDALRDFFIDAQIRLDAVAHAIAFAQLQNEDGAAQPVHEVDQERFNQAMNISAHSLSRLCLALKPLLQTTASIIALTYAGASQVKVGYNLMGIAKAALEAEIKYLAFELGALGIRVNGISAGPIRTLAASGVPGFKQRLQEHAEKAFIQRNVTAEEVAHCGVFLMSAAASGISGEIIFVDGGAHQRG